MIIGIGTDIIEIYRIEKAIALNRFMERCFTQAEIDWLGCRNISSAAGNFAGKEAVAKALLTGFRDFVPNDIEILRDTLGKPYVTLYNGAKKRAEDLGINRFHISISHCNRYAVAYVVAEKTE